MTPRRGPPIEVLAKRGHSKASEEYVDVIFRYEDGTEWRGSVPYYYRRTGLFAESEEEINAAIGAAHDAMHPKTKIGWLAEQKRFWSETNKHTTRPFFEVLKNSEWKCQRCDLPPNPNFARRIQDIKEMGYTIATDTKRRCEKCRGNTTQLIMLRLPRGVMTGYETMSPSLTKRILVVREAYDPYDATRRSNGLLPDHKFPEIRWDEATRAENPETMTDNEIRQKFQLLTNQRNQQKREACRTCFQTGRRGTPFGIPYFHHGNSNWPADVPIQGRKAEAGCVGCGWYDLQLWREKLIAKLVHED